MFNSPGEGSVSAMQQLSNLDGPLIGRKDDSVVPQSAVSHYFAAAPTDEIAQELQAKVDLYYTYIGSANLAELWRRSYRAYYGMRQNSGANGWGIFDSGGLVASGDQGEIVRCKVNQFANLVTHQLSTATSNRPAVQCRAVNADAKSLVSARLGNGVLEYFLRERKIEINYSIAIETALVLSEGYIALGWDATKGKEYGRGPHGGVIYDGDLVATNFTPFQVIKDVTKNSEQEQSWVITHSKRNKYDLVSKYAKDNSNLQNQILSCSSDETTANYRSFADPSKIIAATSFGVQDSDDIPYMEFYHKKTDAMPEGRYSIFINGDILLFDGPLPFREVPVYRVAPKNIIGTPFGWTVAFDILALQELLDKLYTVVSSNVLGSGVQNFWLPPGSGVTTSQLGGNRALIESIVKPEVLDLLRTAPEVYAYINKVEQVMQTLAGVSAVSRGDLPSKDLSGSAMAFLASQAVTFSSGLQQSANQLLENVSTGCINILKDYASTPRIATIAGKQNVPQMLTYMGKDLEPINNVVCDATSAVSKTTAGKIAIADNLLKAGMVETPQEYITLVETGQMEPMTRNSIMENELIQQENQWLLEMKAPRALRTDRHDQHIQEHTTILSSPESRMNAELVMAVDAHIREHEQLKLQMQMQDPMFLASTQQAPSPFPQQATPQPQQPQANVGNVAGIAATVNPQSAVAQKAETVRAPRLPSLPKGSDPQTQENYEQLKQAQGY